MDYESIFNFLDDDKKFDQVYQECLDFESAILNSDYSTRMQIKKRLKRRLSDSNPLKVFLFH